jgi:hypothetical protein
MAKKYWVIGGEYADTDFITMADGGMPERHGPFNVYEDAKDVWARLSWTHIDDAHVRYTIETEDASAYWVVGGEYADTGFENLADGKEEERYGPFNTYKEAQGLWQQLSWQHIDDAHVRYRIDHV